jgi:hypothetical protein
MEELSELRRYLEAGVGANSFASTQRFPALEPSPNKALAALHR